MSHSQHSKTVSRQNSESIVDHAQKERYNNFQRALAETVSTKVVPRNREVKKRRISGMPRWS